jgi:hypothetical protein
VRSHHNFGGSAPAKRQHILLKFIVICLVIALLILGVVIAINP